MKQKRKQFIALSKVIVLSFIVLFCLFPLINTNTIVSSIAKLFKADNEVELDNWEISTVFYDSTVNDGKTPLTEINWDASDGGYGDGEQRTITVQINYKNNNTLKKYLPGEVKIEIPNIAYGYSSYDRYYGAFSTARLRSSIDVGANYSQRTNYDWDFQNSNSGPSNKHLIYYFTNAKTLEEKTNLEGSIQIVYTFTSVRCSGFLYSYNTRIFDEESKSNMLGHGNDFNDTCTHQLSKEIKSRLSINTNNNWVNVSEGNEMLFDYKRTYNHVWRKNNYTIEKTAEKIASLDGLGSNANDYIWVKYKFTVNGYLYAQHEDPYPYIPAKKVIVREELPNGCIALNRNLEPISNNNGEYDITDVWYHNDISGSSYMFVGYPKSTYNSSNNNLEITNNVKLYVEFSDGETVYQDDDSIEIDLNDYYYTYPSQLYSFTKKVSSHYYLSSANRYPLYYDSLIGADTNIGSGGRIYYALLPNVLFSGNKMDVKFGDDLVYVQNGNNYRKLNDDEYYFSYIEFPHNVYNGNNVKIQNQKYNCELWVRYKNNDDYSKYETFKNDTNLSWQFSAEDGISAYYFIIKELEESFRVGDSLNGSNYSIITINSAKNIDTSGKIYNFGFIQVIIDNQVVNQTVNNIEEDTLRQEINSYDNNMYQGSVQRYFDFVEYDKYALDKVKHYLEPDKSSTWSQNAAEEKFDVITTLKLQNSIDSTGPSDYEFFTYGNTIPSKNLLVGWEIYDILPLGMNLTSTEQEIKNSFSCRYWNGSSSFYFRVYDANNHFSPMSEQQYKNLIISHTRVSVINNYKNSNRSYVRIVVDLTDNPIVVNHYSYSSYYAAFSLKSSVSYDDFSELGNSYTNTVYAKYFDRNINEDNFYLNRYSRNTIKDDGNLDELAYDINSNNIIDEDLAYKKNTFNINSIISTNQDVQVSVQSDKSNYDTGKVDTSNDSEYYYKLRARTGSNDVTNLVIYDSLEKFAKDPNMANVLASGGKGSWQGEFLGIDTSYAESKGYTVKTYYSENEEVGNLKDDDSWKAYTDSVDKTKVKSLAFEYLDDEGHPAILPANSLTYVLIKMKSPADENIKTLAYNGCWTEWNAIDPISGNTVDFITGINSNIVKVALPSSVEPVDIDFVVDKYWKDNNDELDLRPDNITIQVVPDDDLTQAIDVPLGVANADSGNANHWTTTISVPKYDNDGNTINYTLRENEIRLSDGYKYTPEIEDDSITNVLNKEIVLKKKWVDNTNSYLTRPGNITYNLKQNGNQYKEIAITGDYSTNEWTKTITVPVYDSSNNEYEYSISEVNVNNYVSSCEDFTCSNKLTGKETINVKKEWKDNNNSYNTRPDEITIKVLQNGNQYKSVSLNSSNNWNSDVEVDKYDSNGRKYVYTVSEEEVDEYGLVTYDQNTYKVTNTLKANIDITITKNWIDDNNSSNTRPNELTVTLLQNGEDYREITLTGDSNTWTSVVEVPKYDNNQKEYKYSIKEINTSEEYSDITYDDELTVTNKLSKKTNLTIKKKWIDHNNDFSSRPNEVKIELLRDGELFRSLTLSGNSDTWEKVVNDVEVYDENGKKYNYTIREESINKYEKVTYDQSKLEVTNELTDIPKVTLYFTVVNGYVDPKTGKMKYDEFGLKEILKKYNKTLEDEYIFKFKLENIDTNKTYEGKLSTKGVLEFKDIPYGEYKAVVGKDKLFEFVDMLSIKDVNGVSFKKIGEEGYITIKPTGENIIFGAKIINKISAPIRNPKTGMNIIFIIAFVLLLPLIITRLLYKKQEC